MKKKRIIFLCRYSIKELDMNINYSVNRKVSGIMSLFESLNYSTWILKTSDFSNYSNSNKYLFKVNNNILLNFNYKFKIFPRFLNYFISIVHNSLILYRLKNKFDVIIFWDFLPDTFLPILFNNINKKKLIGDIEELISKDPEASWIFKNFENFFINKFNLQRCFVSNSAIKISEITKYFTLNGFYAENIYEEHLCNIMLNSYSRSEKHRVFYSSRFDKNRGIDIMIELMELDKHNQYFRFIICGFGSESMYKKIIKLNNPNVEVFYEVERIDLLNKLINSEISINLLKNLEFGNNSFPSKLIEYNCLGGKIFSNIEYEQILDNCIKVKFDSKEIYKALINFKNDISEVRNIDKNKNEIKKYSISSKTKELNIFLND